METEKIKPEKTGGDTVWGVCSTAKPYLEFCISNNVLLEYFQAIPLQSAHQPLRLPPIKKLHTFQLQRAPPQKYGRSARRCVNPGTLPRHPRCRLRPQRCRNSHPRSPRPHQLSSKLFPRLAPTLSARSVQVPWVCGERGRI